MDRSSLIAIGVLAGGLLAAVAQNTTPVNGQWMIDGPAVDGKVQLTLHGRRDHGSFTNSSALPLDALRGLAPAALASAGGPVRFEIVRDAGTLACQGYFNNGDGSGSFTFSPNPRFVSEMQAQGFQDLTPDTVFAMAVHDVSLAWVRELRGLGLNQLNTHQLLAMRIHGVSADFIRELKALGYQNLAADQLVAMRIHGVTAEFARGLKDAGYEASTDQMVAMRIHGAGLDFIKEIKALGYSPSIDQLIAMRIHGVSPEFIRNLQGRGMKQLSVDQLVSMKIHGIDE